MANYRLSRPAREDVSEILVHVSSDSIEAAVALNERFQQVFDVLARNPPAGSERPDLCQNIRSFPMGSYVILYRPFPAEIVIARVRHSIMDLTELLEGLN